MVYFFTADQHFSHANIIKYCNRPFDNVREMDSEIIKRHNSVVTDKDIQINNTSFEFMVKRLEDLQKHIDKVVPKIRGVVDEK